jgi:NADH/NAD ratio-sensing transcriptional regulator Rex
MVAQHKKYYEVIVNKIKEQEKEFGKIKKDFDKKYTTLNNDDIYKTKSIYCKTRKNILMFFKKIKLFSSIVKKINNHSTEREEKKQEIKRNYICEKANNKAEINYLKINLEFLNNFSFLFKNGYEFNTKYKNYFFEKKIKYNKQEKIIITIFYIGYNNITNKLNISYYSENNNNFDIVIDKDLPKKINEKEFNNILNICKKEFNFKIDEKIKKTKDMLLKTC